MKEYTDQQLERAAEIEGRLLLDIRERLEGVEFRSALDDAPVRLSQHVIHETIHALTPLTSSIALTIVEGES